MARYGLIGACVVATLVTVGASSVRAQTYSNVVSFGDSLSDNGNTFRANPAAATASTPYLPLTNGRFSNGPTWAELLANAIHPQSGAFGSMLGVGQPLIPGTNVNFAFGGARSDTAIASPPGVPVQIGLYRLAGGTLGTNTLATIWSSGANDIFQQLPIAAGNPATALAVMTATSTAAAANTQASVQALIAAGARTVLVGNLPDLGSVPQFAGTAAAPLAGASSAVYNSALVGNLFGAAAANPGTNIILFDTNRLFQAVLANPSAFGLGNVTQACVLTPSCFGNPAAQAQFLFWDGVHPTATAHTMLAALAEDYIFYGNQGLGFGSLTEVSEATRQASFDATLAHLNDLAAMARLLGQAAGPAQVTFSAEGSTSSIDARGVMPGYDVTTGSARLFIDRAFSAEFRAGAAVAYTHNDVSASPFGYHTNGGAADAYLAWRSGAFEINAVAGFGIDSFDDIQRRSFLGVLQTGSTSGTSYGGVVQLGYVMPAGTFTFTPQGSIGVIHASVDGYTESGVSAPYVFSSRDVTAVVGEIDLRVDTAFTPTLLGHALIGYRGNLSYTGDPVTVGIANNPARPISTTIGKPNANALRLGAGVQGAINAAVSVAVEYEGAISSDRDVHAGRVRVSVRF